ncbi:MAG TPA: nitroreductase/quinone reductase family protein [Amycolatopsis sp.]|nr:nitroreductase/quinone reductase family protein [Amycolatopsis sp.]
MSPYATTSERHARNTSVIADLRANGGRTSAGQTLVILTTVGARSGREQQIPVCVREDGGDLIIAASAGGQARHPQWYANIVASPVIGVEYLGERYRAEVTTVANGPDRDRLFQMMSEEITGIYGYQDKCRDHRQIPIMRLRRVEQ